MKILSNDKTKFKSCFSLLLPGIIAQLVKNLPTMQIPAGSIPGSGRSTGEGIGYSSSILGLPYGSAGKESVCNVGDLGSIPGLGRSSGEEKRYPLQYSGPENSYIQSMGKSQTRLSDFHFHSNRIFSWEYD